MNTIRTLQKSPTCAGLVHGVIFNPPGNASGHFTVISSFPNLNSKLAIFAHCLRTICSCRNIGMQYNSLTILNIFHEDELTCGIAARLCRTTNCILQEVLQLSTSVPSCTVRASQYKMALYTGGGINHESIP